LTWVLFDAFYCAPVASHDCVLHTPDASPGIPSDIHGPAVSYARLSDDLDISADRIYSFCNFYSSRLFDLLDGILSCCNIVDPWRVDCMEKYFRNEGK
jgi:hypothetical protein